MQILYAGILSIRDEKKQVLTEEMLVISVGREDRLPPPPHHPLVLLQNGLNDNCMVKSPYNCNNIVLPKRD